MITAHDLVDLIAKKKVSNPFHFEGQRDMPLSESEICALELSYGISFTETYRQHLISEGAGDFGFGWIYSPDPKSEFSLWSQYDILPSAKGIFLPFSDNGCGDYYCFPIVDGICGEQIVWLDHEAAYKPGKSEITDFRDFVVKNCLEPA